MDLEVAGKNVVCARHESVRRQLEGKSSGMILRYPDESRRFQVEPLATKRLFRDETIEEQFLGEREKHLFSGFLMNGMRIVTFPGCFIGESEDEADVVTGVRK